MRLLPVLALLAVACVDPFDPWAWRVETRTVCTFTLSHRVDPSCERQQCEVRGPTPTLPAGQRAAVVEDRREWRNCIRLAGLHGV